MQAKQVAASIAFSIATLSGAAFAGPLDGSEIKALAYVAVPFGGASASQRAPVLGFAVDHVRREAAGLFGTSGFMTPLQSAENKRSLLDMRFNTRTQGWERFRVGGVDALTYSTRMRADGTTETVATLGEIPTWAIVAGVVVGAAVIHDATKRDKKDSPPTCPPGTVPIVAGGIWTCV